MAATCATHMTSEQFRTEYHLLDRVSDGTVETHHAQAAAGVMVMVHFLRGAGTRNAAILERIERLETERRQKVLRIIEVDGVTAVVTRFILDLTSFEDWLGGDDSPGRSQPGEFTRLFAVPAQQQQQEPAPQEPAPQETAPPRTSKLPEEPGESTRALGPHRVPEPAQAIPDPLFRDHPSPAFPGPDPHRPVGPAGALERPQYEIDSYRERLAAPAADASPFPPPLAAPLPPPPLAAPTGPSEFTRVVGSMPAPHFGQPPAAPAAPPPPRPKPPPASTRLLLFALLGVLIATILFVVIFTVLA